MVRLLDLATQLALRARGAQVQRNLVVITAKDRATGEPRVHGFWDDIETIVTNVVSGEDGSIVSRSFVGDGAIISCDPVPMRIGLEVRTIQLVLNPLHPAVEALLRGDDRRDDRWRHYGAGDVRRRWCPDPGSSSRYNPRTGRRFVLESIHRRVPHQWG